MEESFGESRARVIYVRLRSSALHRIKSGEGIKKFRYLIDDSFLFSLFLSFFAMNFTSTVIRDVSYRIFRKYLFGCLLKFRERIFIFVIV